MQSRCFLSSITLYQDNCLQTLSYHGCHPSGCTACTAVQLRHMATVLALAAAYQLDTDRLVRSTARLPGVHWHTAYVLLMHCLTNNNAMASCDPVNVYSSAHFLTGIVS